MRRRNLAFKCLGQSNVTDYEPHTTLLIDNLLIHNEDFIFWSFKLSSLSVHREAKREGAELQAKADALQSQLKVHNIHYTLHVTH